MRRKVSSAGGVVFRRTARGVEVLLILDRFGRWTLPKGHLEPGEGPEEAALREIREETGIMGRLVEPLPPTVYVFRDRRETVEKTVHYFLVEAVEGEITAQKGEVEAVRWFPAAEIPSLRQYENNRDVLRRALERLGV